MNNQNKYPQHLRQRIVATASAKQGWCLDDLHAYMSEWGYGSSLRLLNIRRLQELLEIVSGTGKPKPGYVELDKQGKYCYHLMKLAGWTLPKLQTFWLNKFHKNQYSELSPGEIGATTRMLIKYANGEVATSHQSRNK